METALINMFMGMGVVFSVLILISLIINCFKIFPYLEEKFKKSKDQKKDVKKKATKSLKEKRAEKKSKGK